MSPQQLILEYWFNGLHDAAVIDKNSPVVRKWFSGGKTIDEEIRDRFADDLEKAKQGEYQDWMLTAHGRLALVILFDQFSRNIFRNTARAFEADPLALELTLNSVDDKMDQQLPLVQRIFLYLPLMHSEKQEVQKLSLACFQALVQLSVEKSPQNTAYYESTLGFARRHHDIIKQFGRFPHRNEILNRPSTPEELEFLTRILQ